MYRLAEPPCNGYKINGIGFELKIINCTCYSNVAYIDSKTIHYTNADKSFIVCSSIYQESLESSLKHVRNFICATRGLPISGELVHEARYRNAVELRYTKTKICRYIPTRSIAF